jgi:hypothetical protein
MATKKKRQVKQSTKKEPRETSDRVSRLAARVVSVLGAMPPSSRSEATITIGNGASVVRFTAADLLALGSYLAQQTPGKRAPKKRKAKGRS